jgi:hypothetical protein
LKKSLINLLTNNSSNPIVQKELKIYEYLEHEITSCIHSNKINQLIDEFDHYMHVNHNPKNDKVIIEPNLQDTYPALYHVAVSNANFALGYPIPFSALSALLKYVMEELDYTPKELDNTWIPFNIHEYNKMRRNTPYLVHIVTEGGYSRYTTVELQKDGALTACIGGLHDLRDIITHYSHVKLVKMPSPSN